MPTLFVLLIWLPLIGGAIWFVGWVVAALRRPAPEVNRSEEWEQERREVVALKRGERR